VKGQVNYNPIEEEKKWWLIASKKNRKLKPLPPKHQFAHGHIRSRLYDTLVILKCDNDSLILEVGCGSGEDAIYIKKASKNIVGVDIALVALRRFTSKGFQGILADVKKLPFPNNSFNYVVSSGLLHHLIGQGDLKQFLREFVRVVRVGGYVVALEPNLFNPSGFLMNIFNKIKPGVTGLVPHERALSPLYLTKIFSVAGLENVECVSASYVWNRLPLFVSKFISKHEDEIRFRKPFNLFGWFVIAYGQKTNIRGTIR